VIGSSLSNARYYKLVTSRYNNNNNNNNNYYYYYKLVVYANTFKSAIGSAEYVFIASCAPSGGTCFVTPTAGTN